jgi:hypothetical protein
MKRKQNILFRIIFLLALLVNIGLVEYSGISIFTNKIESFSGENGEESLFNADNTHVFENFTDQVCYIRLKDLQELHLRVPDDCHSIQNFCVSVWHPPKIT